MERKRDKYDEAIDNLLLSPKTIRNAWMNPYSHENGCLFQLMSKHDGNDMNHPDKLIGCVSQIRCDPNLFCSENNELAEMIKNDERIPNQVNEETTRSQLEVFAEYQRKADAIFGRE